MIYRTSIIKAGTRQLQIQYKQTTETSYAELKCRWTPSKGCRSTNKITEKLTLFMDEENKKGPAMVEYRNDPKIRHWLWLQCGEAHVNSRALSQSQIDTD